MNRPDWWAWELAFTPHIERRMEERDVTELDLRSMLDGASEVRSRGVEGRFEVKTRHAGQPWIVVLEPDPEEERVYVVTAFRRDSR